MADRDDVFTEIDALEERLARARAGQTRLEERRDALARRDGWFPSPWQIRLLVVASLVGAMLAWGFGRRHIQPSPVEYRVTGRFPFEGRKPKLPLARQLAVRACLLGDRASCVQLRDALAPLGAPVGILVGQILCEEHDPSCAPADGASNVP